MSAAPQAMKMDEFSALARQIEAEVGRVIVGQREIVRSAIICIIAGRHALLEGRIFSVHAAIPFRGPHIWYASLARNHGNRNG